jgi:hypothetical protein
MYNAALTVERPPAPVQSYDEWYSSQTKIAEDTAAAAEATCREQNGSMFNTTIDEALINAEIKSMIEAGTPEEEARKQGNAKLADKKREKADKLDQLCDRSPMMVDPNGYDVDGRTKNAVIDELHRRIWNRVWITLGGLALILMTPIAIGYGKRVYGWVQAGK